MARKYSTQLGKSNSSALCNLLRKNSLSGNIRVVSTLLFFSQGILKMYPIPYLVEFKGWNWKSIHVGAGGHSEFYFTTILWNS